MANNNERIRRFGLRLKNRKDEILKSTNKKLLIDILYKKAIDNINDNKDVNNKKYTPSKHKKTKLLKNTGRLIKSIKKYNNGIKIEGNKLDKIKRNTNNFGKIIKRKNFKYLTIKHDKGFSKVKKVKIPKREFFPTSKSEISKESLESFKNIVLSKFNKGI